MGRRATSLPRGLSRVDHEVSNVHLWRVQKPDGAFIYFGDAKYGGRIEALRAALLQLVSLPIIGIQSSKSIRNTTGTIGVSPVRYKGKLTGFKAMAGSVRSTPYYKKFSIRDYGESVALRLAVLARMDFIEKTEALELTKRNKLIRRMLARLERNP